MCNKLSFSKLNLFLIFILLGITSLLYYPKFLKNHTESTLSWDVSGYYLYLPAIFIHKDLEDLAFFPEILEKYKPTPDFQQAIPMDNGHRIIKYSCGQAIMMLPAFLVADVMCVAGLDTRDGFSLPYQVAISIWGLLLSIAGLWLIYSILIRYYPPILSSLSVLIIALGSNFLEYGSITNAMTHNYLFFLYGALLWFSEKYWASPTLKYASMTGIIVGLMTLIRPTEIVAAAIPVFWKLQFSAEALKFRFKLFLKYFHHIIAAALIGGLVILIQLLYWKTVSGYWYVYSYQDQGFSWLSPHIIEGLWSGRAGWLVYSPLMALTLIGLVVQWRQKHNGAWFTGIFLAGFCYITFAWDIWWYGGSVGQRALIQIYPLLTFPIAACLAWAQSNIFRIGLFFVIILSGLNYNFWLIHQAHKGGLLVPGEMTSQYLQAIVFKKTITPETRKLLDAQHIYKKPLHHVDTLMQWNSDAIKPECLDAASQYTEPLQLTLPDPEGWNRFIITCKGDQLEQESWRMTQCIVQYLQDTSILKTDMIRLQRWMSPGLHATPYLDSKIPPKANQVKVYLWHASGYLELCVEKIVVLQFKG